MASLKLRSTLGPARGLVSLRERADAAALLEQRSAEMASGECSQG